MSKNNEVKDVTTEEKHGAAPVQAVVNVRDQRKAERRAKKEARAAAEAENPTWRTKLKKAVVPALIGVGSFILGGVVASLGKDDNPSEVEYYDASHDSSSESEEL